MWSIPAPFYSRSLGDHPAGDGLTKLQVLFAGSSTDDTSAFAVGAGTEVSSAGANVVATEGLLTVKLSGAVSNYHTWSKNGLARQPNTGFTCEVFVKAEEFDPNPSSTGYFIELDAFGMATSRVGFNGYASSRNDLTIYAIAWYSYTSTVDIFNSAVLGSTFHHIAWVCDATANGDLRVYLDGVQVASYSGGSIQKTVPYLGEIRLGGVGAAFNQTNFYFSGLRVRHAEMYTGSSFTPPSSPSAWGPP